MFHLEHESTILDVREYLNHDTNQIDGKKANYELPLELLTLWTRILFAIQANIRHVVWTPNDECQNNMPKSSDLVKSHDFINVAHMANLHKEIVLT